jgi:PII-like signaling protein
MRIEGDAKQLTIYVSSTQQWHGRSLYSAIVHVCQERGIAGATVTRCLEGYGSSRQLHTGRLVDLSEALPVRIDIIDIAERIDPLLSVLEGMIGEGLISIQNVHIVKYLPDPKS